MVKCQLTRYMLSREYVVTLQVKLTKKKLYLIIEQGLSQSSKKKKIKEREREKKAYAPDIVKSNT